MFGNNGDFVQAELVSSGGWLLTERGQLVNLDKIESSEIQTLHYGEKDQKVVLYPSGEGEPFIACTGSQKKCEEYLKVLIDYVGAKEIVIFETHPCSCQCGCKEQIIEGFEICDNCTGEHSLEQESMVFK